MRRPLEQEFYRLFGQRVRALREKRGFTQEHVAQVIGVKRTSVTNLERGNQNIPLCYLLRLAQCLGCEMAELVPSHADLGRRAPAEYEVVTPPFGEISEKTTEVIRQYTAPSREERR